MKTMELLFFGSLVVYGLGSLFFPVIRGTHEVQLTIIASVYFVFGAWCHSQLIKKDFEK